MQQETPQVGPPTLPSPSMPPQPPATPPAPQPHEEQSFYQPAPAAVGPAPIGVPVDDDDDFDTPFSWEASEYIHMDKGSMWLVGLGIIVLIAVGIAVFLHEWIFAILTIVMGVAMGVFAFRPPHVLHYTLTDEGVQIADKVYKYKDFRAFGVLEDGAFYTMEFIPTKRFAPALSIYFAEADGEHIVDIVGDHLPMEKIQPDIIDTVMRRLRF